MAEWYHVKGMRMWADRGLAWAIPEDSMSVDRVAIDFAGLSSYIANVL